MSASSNGPSRQSHHSHPHSHHYYHSRHHYSTSSTTTGSSSARRPSSLGAWLNKAVTEAISSLPFAAPAKDARSYRRSHPSRVGDGQKRVHTEQSIRLYR